MLTGVRTVRLSMGPDEAMYKGLKLYSLDDVLRGAGLLLQPEDEVGLRPSCTAIALA